MNNKKNNVYSYAKGYKKENKFHRAGRSIYVFGAIIFS